MWNWLAATCIPAGTQVLSVHGRDRFQFGFRRLADQIQSTPTAPEVNMRRYWDALLLLTAFAALTIHFVTAHGWLTDDAFISFRYAENLAMGNGLVYNLGEHVEGYSNFLWVLFIAAGIRLGIPPESCALALSFLSAAGTLLVVSYFSSKSDALKGESISHFYPAMLLAGIGSFWIWTFGGGLESVLYAFLGTAAVLRLSFYQKTLPKRSSLVYLSLLCTLVAFLRPEGIIFFGYSFLILGYQHYQSHTWKRLFWFVIPFAMLFSAYLGWKIWYFGGLVPNTVYAKVDPSTIQAWSGLKYVLKFFATYPVLVLFSFIAIAMVKVHRRAILTMTGFLFLYCFFVVLAGGDFMYAYRFMVPVVPILVLLAYKGIEESFSKNHLLWILCAVIILSASQTRFHHNFKYAIENSTTVNSGRIVGKWLARTFPKSTTIALNAAGALPFYSKLRAIDMLGLTETEIARDGTTDRNPVVIGHLKSNARFVLEKNPELILFGSGFGRREAVLHSEIEMSNLQGFQLSYVFREFICEGGTLRLYVRKDFQLPAALQSK